jgi:hypothetical protein
MRAPSTHRNVLEDRFPHLVPTEDGSGGRSYRTTAGREVFSLDAEDRRLRLPIARETLADLFGGLPFPVEARDGASLVSLADVEDEATLFGLIDALEEQSGASSRETPADPAGPRPAASPERRERRGRSARLVAVLAAAAVLLLALFLAYSWRLAQRSLDQDREQWIETLLRR